MNARRAAIARALANLAPAIPAFERMAVLDHAEDSPGLNAASPQTAAWLSLLAVIRHTLTDYDRLQDDGLDPDAARWWIRPEVEAILADWGCRHPLGEDDAGKEVDC